MQYAREFALPAIKFRPGQGSRTGETAENAKRPIIKVEPTPICQRDADWPSSYAPPPTYQAMNTNSLRGTKGVPWYNGIYNALNTPK